MSDNPFSLPLARPEYYTTIHAVLSDCAWQALAKSGVNAQTKVFDGRKLVFELAPGVAPSILFSKKTGSSEPLGILVRHDAGGSLLAEEFAQKVGQAIGIGVDSKGGQALVDSLRAVRPVLSEVYTADTTLWPCLFLQGLAGTLRRDSPPNYMEIIARLYEWGSDGKNLRKHEALRRILGSILQPPADDPTHDLAEAIADAIVAWANSQEGQLSALREIRAFKDTLLAWTSQSASGADAVEVPLPFQGLTRTPYRWFVTALDRLCQDDWRQALPASRWNDWMSCVLRTGIGLGYVHEMRYYRVLAQELLTPDADLQVSWERLRRSMEQPTLSWQLASVPTSQRDVAPRLRQWCSTGDAVRQWVKAADIGRKWRDDAEGSLAVERILGRFRDTLDSARPPEEWRSELRGCLAGQAAKTNVEETIRYSLLCRERHTPGADLYSVLMARGARYVVVDPAEEWLVVIAALTADRPGVSTTLAQLRGSLAMLGIDASREVIVQALERAGLTRSAHDADDALEINPAF